jgi:hypothetical protein
VCGAYKEYGPMLSLIRFKISFILCCLLPWMISSAHFLTTNFIRQNSFELRFFFFLLAKRIISRYLFYSPCVSFLGRNDAMGEYFVWDVKLRGP